MPPNEPHQLCCNCHSFSACLGSSSTHDRSASHAGVREGLEVLYQRCVQGLQPLLADMAPQQLSTALWSSAKLGLNPDAVVPGMTRHLTLRFVELMDPAAEQQSPNAQNAANVLWALATMGHPAATAAVVDPICSHFARLTRHADTKQRPSAQNAANVLWALATMGHTALAEVLDLVCRHFASLIRHADKKQRPSAQAATNVLWALATMGHPAPAEVLDSVTTHFARLTKSAIAKEQPTAQEVANVVWALGTLKHTPSDDMLLDHFCAYMHTLGSQDQRTPDAQNVGNMLWGLKELKHAPSNDVVYAMLNRLVELCRTPDMQPSAQDINISLFACAGAQYSAY